MFLQTFLYRQEVFGLVRILHDTLQFRIRVTKRTFIRAYEIIVDILANLTLRIDSRSVGVRARRRWQLGRRIVSRLLQPRDYFTYISLDLLQAALGLRFKVHRLDNVYFIVFCRSNRGLFPCVKSRFLSVIKLRCITGVFVDIFKSHTTGS